MVQNVSGFSSVVSIIASNSYPTGFPVTTYSNDRDAFNFSDLVVGDFAMGLNGDGISWSKANPIKIELNVVAGSLDDQNLAVLLTNNTPGKSKSNQQDIITLTVVYPDNTSSTASNGVILHGTPGKSFTNDGKLATRTYGFAFESIIGS